MYSLVRTLGSAAVLATLVLGVGGVSHRGVARAGAAQSPAPQEGAVPQAQCRLPGLPAAAKGVKRIGRGVVVDLSERAASSGVVPLNRQGYNYGRGVWRPPAAKQPPAAPTEQ